MQAAQGALDNPAGVMQDIAGEGVGGLQLRLALHGRLVTLRSYLVHWLKIKKKKKQEGNLSTKGPRPDESSRT